MYCDQQGGGTCEQPQFRWLFSDAHQWRFDVMLFWSLNRFSREGETLNYLQRLNSGRCYQRDDGH